MEGSLKLDKYHDFTSVLLDCLENTLSVDQHDPAHPEDSDIIWIKKNPSGSMCEGEYLGISASNNDWFVTHKSADVCGGHPTYWSKSGSGEAFLHEVIHYFKERQKALKIEI